MMDQKTARAIALQTAVEDRIWELWSYRHWYRVHRGWIPDSRGEDALELRSLVRLARKARDLSREVTPEPVPQSTYSHQGHIAHPQPDTCWDCFITQEVRIPEPELRAMYGDR